MLNVSVLSPIAMLHELDHVFIYAWLVSLSQDLIR